MLAPVDPHSKTTVQIYFLAAAWRTCKKAWMEMIFLDQVLNSALRNHATLYFTAGGADDPSRQHHNWYSFSSGTACVGERILLSLQI